MAGCFVLAPSNFEFSLKRIRRLIKGVLLPGAVRKTTIAGMIKDYHDDIYGPEVHEVGPHVVSCMLYIQVIVKA